MGDGNVVKHGGAKPKHIFTGDGNVLCQFSEQSLKIKM